MPFSAYRDNFDAETLAILEAAFNEAWEVVTASGGDFDQEPTRNALAELIEAHWPSLPRGHWANQRNDHCDSNGDARRCQ